MHFDWFPRKPYLGLYCLSVIGLLIVWAAPKSLLAQGPPTPSPTTTQVTLDISTTPSRQAVARQEQFDIFIVVTNKSALEVHNLSLSLFNGDFSAVRLPSFPAPLPGFNSAEGTASIEAKPSAQFKQQQIL